MIDICDEIAYNASDLDDAYSAGLVTAEQVCSATPHLAELDDVAQMQFPGSPERVRMHENIRALINWLVSCLLEGMIAAATGLKTVEEVRAHPARVARLSDEASSASRDLKLFLRSRVYEAEEVESARNQSTAKIAGLFDMFLKDP